MVHSVPKGLLLPGWHTPGDRNLKSESESRSVSHVWLFATPWTVSMEFSRPDRNPTSLIIAGFHLVAKCAPYSPDPSLSVKPMSVGKQSWKQSMQQNHNLSEQDRQIISLYLSIKTSNDNQKYFFLFFNVQLRKQNSYYRCSLEFSFCSSDCKLIFLKDMLLYA